MIRVIAGRVGGRRLRVPSVPGLRPTTDRARESLFNVLAGRLDDARVLDLFAGSGALGIEALSRGARTATFVDRSRRARRAIRDNLEACGFEDRAEIVGGGWHSALRRLRQQDVRFGVAFLDPPYDWERVHRCIEELERDDLLEPDGWAIVEHRAGRPVEIPVGWTRHRLLRVGDSAFSLLQRSGGGPSGGDDVSTL